MLTFFQLSGNKHDWKRIFVIISFYFLHLHLCSRYLFCTFVKKISLLGRVRINKTVHNMTSAVLKAFCIFAIYNIVPVLIINENRLVGILCLSF